MDEALRLFMIDLVEFKCSESLKIKEELNPKVLNEGFADSFDDALLHLFYQFALVDGFHGLTEENQDKTDLMLLVGEYQLIWKNIFYEMEDLSFKASFLHSVPEKARYFINTFQLPTPQYIDDPENMRYFGNEVESATKYLNFSLSLAIYAYYSRRHNLNDLAWISLLKARELYAYFAAIRVISFSNKGGRNSYQKTKARSREAYNSLIPFLLLQLKNPTMGGWPNLENALDTLTERLYTQLQRYKNFNNYPKDQSELRTIIAEWIENDKLVKSVYQEFSATENLEEKFNRAVKKFSGQKQFSSDEITKNLLLEPFSDLKYTPPAQVFKKGDKVVTLPKDQFEQLERGVQELHDCRHQLERCEKDLLKIPLEIRVSHLFKKHRLKTLRETRRQRMSKWHIESQRLRNKIR